MISWRKLQLLTSHLPPLHSRSCRSDPSNEKSHKNRRRAAINIAFTSTSPALPPYQCCVIVARKGRHFTSGHRQPNPSLSARLRWRKGSVTGEEFRITGYSKEEDDRGDGRGVETEARGHVRRGWLGRHRVRGWKGRGAEERSQIKHVQGYLRIQRRSTPALSVPSHGSGGSARVTREDHPQS